MRDDLDQRSEPTKVEALIVGTQKGGTTALWSYLAQHERVCTGEVKELHFFDRDHWDASTDYESYHRNFRNCESLLKMEATPIYMYWRPCMKRIHAYNPRMRLVAILRHPVERAYSHWEMEFSRGSEPLHFSQAVATELAELGATHRRQDRVRSYIDRGHYWSQIKRVLEYFPEPQLLLLRNEDLQTDHRNTLHSVNDFLSLPPYQHFPEPQAVYPTQKLQTLPPLDPEMRSDLVDLYRPDVCALERHTGWDLTTWKQ